MIQPVCGLVISVSIENHAIKLPADLSIRGLLGEGKRSRVFEGACAGRLVAIKLYRRQYIDKYRQRYGVDIAQFEYERNKAFHDVAGLRAYTVEPLMVLRPDEGYSHGFVQELAPGRRLLDVVFELGYLPEEAYQAGLLIVDRARAAGIHDLDINDANVNLTRRPSGWTPIVYDFNIMPQYLHPSNPLISLGFKLGLKDRSYRDMRSVQGWRMRGSQAAAAVRAS